MKAKLLKKVRRRYEIICVTRKGIDDDYPVLSVPYYILSDSEESMREKASSTVEYIMALLVVWIRRDYGRFFKDKSKSHKVWYQLKSK